MAKKMDVRPVAYNFECFQKLQLLKSLGNFENLQQLEVEPELTAEKNRDNVENSSSSYQPTDSNFEDIDENFEGQNLSKKLRKLHWYQGFVPAKTPKKFCDFLKCKIFNQEEIIEQSFRLSNSSNEAVPMQREKNLIVQNRQQDTFSSVVTEGLNEERLVPILPEVKNLKLVFQYKIKNILV